MRCSWARRGPHSRARTTAVSELLKMVVVEGWLIAVDALLTQREVARRIIERGGDYLMVVKANQPRLLQDIGLCFASGPLLGEVRGRAHTVDKGRGRPEVRQIVTSDALRGFLAGWPGLEQVIQVTRTATRLRTGETTTGQVYAIASLPPARGSPAVPLGAIRGRWTIEKGVHWVRDATPGEDSCAVHKGRSFQVLAALRTQPWP